MSLEHSQWCTITKQTSFFLLSLFFCPLIATNLEGNSCCTIFPDILLRLGLTVGSKQRDHWDYRTGLPDLYPDIQRVKNCVSPDLHCSQRWSKQKHSFEQKSNEHIKGNNWTKWNVFVDLVPCWIFASSLQIWTKTVGGEKKTKTPKQQTCLNHEVFGIVAWTMRFVGYLL